jgi:hypothetical protein
MEQNHAHPVASHKNGRMDVKFLASRRPAAIAATTAGPLLEARLRGTLSANHRALATHLFGPRLIQLLLIYEF